jgi:hypothetical protein
MVNIIDSVTVCTLSDRPLFATTFHVKSNQKDFESIGTQIAEINKFMPCNIRANIKTSLISFDFIIRNEKYESESPTIIISYLCHIVDEDDFYTTYKNLLSHIMITKNEYDDDIFKNTSDMPFISADRNCIDFSVKCEMIMFDKMTSISGDGKSNNVFSIKN